MDGRSHGLEQSEGENEKKQAVHQPIPIHLS